jgi:hypothetical protein
MGCGGGALGAPLWVALLLMLSRGQRMEWSGMIYLLIIPPPKVPPYPLYNEIGQVHGGLESESTVYMRRSLGGHCRDALWTLAVSWSRRSLGHRPATLF